MDIQEKTGTTFVIVTHDQEEAMTMASRIAVMDHGKIVQVDTPDRIYETPNSVYVAGFIGDVNVLSGRSSNLQADTIDLHWADGQPPIKGMPGDGVSAESKASFVIRPEKVSISLEKPTELHNKVKGKVEDIAYLGNISTYYVRLHNGTLIKSQTVNNRRLSRRAITWQDDVWLSWRDTAGFVLSE